MIRRLNQAHTHTHTYMHACMHTHMYVKVMLLLGPSAVSFQAVRMHIPRNCTATTTVIPGPGTVQVQPQPGATVFVSDGP